MNDLNKLIERFNKFDELERKGGEVILITQDENLEKAEFQSEESKIVTKGATVKSVNSVFSIDEADLKVPDDFIEKQIERMIPTSIRLNSSFKKKALDNSLQDSFPTDYPIIGKSGGGRNYTLAADYIYRADAGYRITAHRGFVTDLASVPRIFWLLINPDELSLAAPIIHDLLYRSGGKLPKNQVEVYRFFTKDDSDLLFLEIMKKEKIPNWRAKAAYFAVQKFGKSAWQGSD